MESLRGLSQTPQETVSTAEVEQNLTALSHEARLRFLGGPQEHVVALIARHYCAGWNKDAVSHCYRAGRELRDALSDEEANVIEELWSLSLIHI